MKIAICDDEEIIVKRLSHMVEDYFKNRGIPLSLSSFTNGQDFLKSAEKTDYDIVLLDIYIGESHGIRIARALSNLQRTKLIFITTSTDFAIQAFSLSAVHYLLKPVSKEQLSEALDRCIQGGGDAKVLQFSTDGGTLCVRADHILYVEAQAKKSLLSTTDQAAEILCSHSFQEICAMLQGDEKEVGTFLACHRSYLVNLLHVERFDGTEFAMRNGHLIPVSRAKKQAAAKAYEAFLLAGAKM